MIDRRTGAKLSGAEWSIFLADRSHAMTLARWDHQVFAPLPIAYPRFASQRQSTLVPRYSCCKPGNAREGCPISNSSTSGYERRQRQGRTRRDPRIGERNASGSPMGESWFTARTLDETMPIVFDRVQE